MEEVGREPYWQCCREDVSDEASWGEAVKHRDGAWGPEHLWVQEEGLTEGS